jgi:DNA end-binding protein Ku
MPARAIWKGVLKIGPEQLPVKLYSAVQDRSVHFHILEAKTKQPVKQIMVDPDSGEQVPKEEIQRGVEIDPGTFVILNEEDQKAFEPEPGRDIQVSSFIPNDKINDQWYERPYYLGPDGEDATAYFELAQALGENEREGVASWVMRNKKYVGALRATGGYLMLVTLRHAEEVMSAQELPKPGGRPLDDREVKMAQQLVSVLEAPFQPEDFRDEYRDRVMQFIEAKAKGRSPKLTVVKKKQSTTSLLDALSASLQKAKTAGGKAVA